MRFVLDASVTLCWCFHDENSAIADHSFAQLQDGAEAIVPMIWWFEVRNAITLGIKKGRIDDLKADAFFGRLNNLIIRIAKLPESKDVLNLAKRHNLTFYDACYLELAARERTALATLDRALANAARAEQVALIGN